MRTSRSPLCAAVVGLCGLSLPFAAATLHAADMNVTATVQSTCALNLLTNADFGTITPGGGDVNTSGSVEWACTNGTAADIEINNGANYSGTTRRMTDGSTFIAYTLYQDAGLSVDWGLQADGDELATGGGTGMTNFTTQNVYAEILDAAYIDAAPGAYSDTVTIDILF